MRLSFIVDEWAAVTPTRRSRAAWVAWARGVAPDPDASSPAALRPLLRRRITQIGQMAFEAALTAQDVAKFRFVFASRHGEFRRTLSLLEALTGDDGVSPADFSLSVHNALMGLLSISSSNPRGHTTIASGEDTFLSALIESASTLAAEPDVPVLLVYYDEPLPAPYDAFNAPDETTLALAVLLKPVGDGIAVNVEVDQSGVPGKAAATSQALDFIRFLLSDADPAAAQIPPRPWRAQRAAA